MKEVGYDIFILNSDWRVINPCHSSRAIRRREGRFPLSLVPSFIYTILLLISQLSTWANVRAVSHVSIYFFTILYILTWGSIEISTTVLTCIFLISKQIIIICMRYRKNIGKNQQDDNFMRKKLSKNIK